MGNVWEKKGKREAVWEKKIKREAGANEQAGLTKVKVESLPRWDLHFFLVYRYKPLYPIQGEDPARPHR